MILGAGGVGGQAIKTIANDSANGWEIKRIVTFDPGFITEDTPFSETTANSGFGDLRVSDMQDSVGRGPVDSDGEDDHSPVVSIVKADHLNTENLKGVKGYGFAYGFKRDPKNPLHQGDAGRDYLAGQNIGAMIDGVAQLLKHGNIQDIVAGNTPFVFATNPVEVITTLVALYAEQVAGIPQDSFLGVSGQADSNRGDRLARSLLHEKGIQIKDTAVHFKVYGQHGANMVVPFSNIRYSVKLAGEDTYSKQTLGELLSPEEKVRLRTNLIGQGAVFNTVGGSSFNPGATLADMLENAVESQRSEYWS